MPGATPKAQQQQRRGGVGVDGLPRGAPPPPPPPQCVSCVVRECAASIIDDIAREKNKVTENKTRRRPVQARGGTLRRASRPE